MPTRYKGSPPSFLFPLNQSFNPFVPIKRIHHLANGSNTPPVPIASTRTFPSETCLSSPSQLEISHVKDTYTFSPPSHLSLDRHKGRKHVNQTGEDVSSILPIPMGAPVRSSSHTRHQGLRVGKVLPRDRQDVFTPPGLAHRERRTMVSTRSYSTANRKIQTASFLSSCVW